MVSQAIALSCFLLSRFFPLRL